MIARLVARRAELIKELKSVEEALAIARTGEAVEIRTHKNIRNSPLLTTRTDWEGMVVVYADSDLTRVAKGQDHGGWITGEDAAKLLAKGYVDGFTIAFEERTKMITNSDFTDRFLEPATGEPMESDAWQFPEVGPDEDYF